MAQVSTSPGSPIAVLRRPFRPRQGGWSARPADAIWAEFDLDLAIIGQQDATFLRAQRGYVFEGDAEGRRFIAAPFPRLLPAPAAAPRTRASRPPCWNGLGPRPRLAEGNPPEELREEVSSSAATATCSGTAAR